MFSNCQLKCLKIAETPKKNCPDVRQMRKKLLLCTVLMCPHQLNRSLTLLDDVQQKAAF